MSLLVPITSDLPINAGSGPLPPVRRAVLLSLARPFKADAADRIYRPGDAPL